MSSPCPARALLLIVLALSACERERREFVVATPADLPSGAGVSPTSLRAGGTPQPPPNDPRAAVFERNAYHISEGKRWYDWYNCYGCHAAGGGDIGPPLMDDQWRYGGSIEQIHSSIIEGRPNGMPSFRGRMSDQTAWEIAAYVRSMGGNVAKDAAPSRGDELKTTPPNNQVGPTPARPVAPRSDQGKPE